MILYKMVSLCSTLLMYVHACNNLLLTAIFQTSEAVYYVFNLHIMLGGSLVQWCLPRAIIIIPYELVRTSCMVL